MRSPDPPSYIGARGHIWQMPWGSEGDPGGVLVAGVGYTFLHDLSFGPEIVRRLQEMAWPAGVEVTDLSQSPIAVYQQLSERRYDKVILVGAVRRDRAAATIHCYRPDGPLPAEEEIQARIGEGVSGTVSLDSTVIVCRYFGALPADTLVVEVEPEDESWGEGFSPKVAAAVDEVIELVRREALAAVEA